MWIYWMLYINENHVAKFYLVWLEIADGRSHPRVSCKNNCSENLKATMKSFL